MSDKRREGESFEDYKARMREENLYLKHRQKGTMFWKSQELKFVQDDPDDESTKRVVNVGRTYVKEEQYAARQVPTS